MGLNCCLQSNRAYKLSGKKDRMLFILFYTWSRWKWLLWMCACACECLLSWIWYRYKMFEESSSNRWTGHLRMFIKLVWDIFGQIPFSLLSRIVIQKRMAMKQFNWNWPNVIVLANFYLVQNVYDQIDIVIWDEKIALHSKCTKKYNTTSDALNYEKSVAIQQKKMSKRIHWCLHYSRTTVKNASVPKWNLIFRSIASFKVSDPCYANIKWIIRRNGCIEKCTLGNYFPLSID